MDSSFVPSVCCLLMISFIISAFGVRTTITAQPTGGSHISVWPQALGTSDVYKRNGIYSTIHAPFPAPSALIPFQTSHTDPYHHQSPHWHPRKTNRKHKHSHISPQPSNKAPSIAPIISPSPATPKSTQTPSAAFSPVEDCASIICSKPLTNTPFGSPCGCVWPMRVRMRISIPLYTLLLQVSELAKDIASGIFMRQNQIRIIAAESEAQQPGKTLVSIDLVPLESKFDMTSAYLTRQIFLDKQIKLNTSIFGSYEVLYVNYPGLPISPPTAPSSISERDDGPYFGVYNKTSAGKPFGVDVHGKHIEHSRLSGSLIALICLSAVAIVFLCISITWVLLLKCTSIYSKPSPPPDIKLTSHLRPSGPDEFMDGSNTCSRSLSVKSSIIAAYTGSAKTFCLAEIEKATCNFDASRLIGEGGFGLVYKGVLDDGTYAAIKVLKINHQHGDKEFMAEVDMLCRLHHRNLVKLIGICIEAHKRCLVYELIPNGSLDSHLHGGNWRKPPLDWSSRMKIALGAARGLAYLHEDSSPCVIHRDFKSSNILLENDFTPKVSDFGLAQATLAAENAISADVMGTFGYIAPEYALTGHFLVKSDVYSYGVVLLELLTGRKPVDMSQPPGEQNLVEWAHPLLSNQEGVKQAIDPSIGSTIPFDTTAKVAAIALMCVQPEVSHRPFMGEVVQALKLVFDETDEAGISGSVSSKKVSPDQDTGMSGSSGNCPLKSQPDIRAYNSDTDVERGHSVSEAFEDASLTFESHSSASFRRHTSSGPLRMGRGRRLWSMVRTSYGGSMSEHEIWRGSQ